MRARILNMENKVRQACGVHLYEIFEILRTEITTTKHKYPRETKWIICKNKNGQEIRFYWYEVEIIK